jgi:hypothetical protein
MLWKSWLLFFWFCCDCCCDSRLRCCALPTTDAACVALVARHVSRQAWQKDDEGATQIRDSNDFANTMPGLVEKGSSYALPRKTPHVVILEL